MIDWNFDDVTVLQAVQLQGTNCFIVNILLPNFKVRVAKVGCFVFNKCGESLVEPQIGPPLHDNQVAEPLMRQLVANHDYHPLFLGFQRFH